MTERETTNPIIRFFQTYLRHSAIRNGIRRLAPRLRQDYHHGAPYTPDQVTATIGRTATVFPINAAYALAFFCEPSALAAHALHRHEVHDYGRFRREAGEACFDRVDDFNFVAVDNFCLHHGGGHHGHGGHGSDHGGGHHFDGGGHGGDGGGGDGGGGH